MLPRLLHAAVPLTALQAGGPAVAAAVLHRVGRARRSVDLEAAVQGARHGGEEGCGGCETRGWKIQAYCGSPKDNLWIEGKFCCKGARAPEIMGGESGSEKGI
uniref:OVA2 n=1 Tax=Arundo donax TaxID=35708 RepID=A0A0A9G9V0_ARUDO